LFKELESRACPTLRINATEDLKPNRTRFKA
jgi:hypothetical protein